MLLEYLWLNIIKTKSMAIWTVLGGCLQSKYHHYWHGFSVYMAQYYGENVHCILDCVKGVLTA